MMLIYDGDCGMCTKLSQFTQRKLSRKSNLKIKSWQEIDSSKSETLTNYGLTKEDVKTASYVIVKDKKYRGYKSIAKALQELRFPYNVLGKVILVFPLNVVARGMYFLVSKNRHHYLCKRPFS
jgi:predicted DCC family thiol-disulfide oxidoreductase YuxK